MFNVYRKIYREIKKYPVIVIARHIGPDPDSLGSQFALKELIMNKFPSKKVYAIGSYANRFKFMGSLDRLETIDKDNTLLIVLDTPDIKRIDSVNLDDYAHVIKIDHHPVIDHFGDIELVDDNVSSTCQLILEFIFKNRLSINSSVAELLYIGVVSDTGRFMHDYTSVRTFEVVTKLLKKSHINFTSLYRSLYVKPLAEVRFQGYIFENMEVTDSGVAYIKITDDILKEFGVDAASAGNVISDVNIVNEIYVWAFFTEDKKNNVIRANIRSRGPVINDIAIRYGGGGHKYASGAKLTSWKQVDGLIIDLDEVCEEYIRKLN